MLTAIALRDNARAAIQYIKDNWPNDREAEMLTRAAVSPTSTVSGTANDLLAVGAAFFGFMPSSAAVRLWQHPDVLRLDMAGIHSSFVNTVSSAPVPVFIGDAAPFIVAQEAFNPGVTVGPVHKMVSERPRSRQLGEAMKKRKSFHGTLPMEPVGTRTHIP
jgi:hypothetical protein